MTSRELVIKSLEFDSPRRVPRQMWFLPWATLHYPHEVARLQQQFPDDIISAPSFYTTPLPVMGDPYSPGVYRDEWGCTFKNIQPGLIGEVKEPLVQAWSELDKVRLPEERLSCDIDQINAFCQSTGQFVLAGCEPRPFERLQFIRSSVNLLIDLLEQPAELLVLLDRLHQFYLKELELWARTEVDALMFMDDWGAQRSLLISPGLWRQIFKPLYQEYIDLAHSYGKYAFMHSDGYILDIIPDLIELGLDALNSQLFCMGVENLGRQFRGKITFWGEIDRQYLLPFGRQEEIIQAVREVQARLSRQGGVIAQCEFGAGAKPENVALVFETWNQF
jgi:uroporphyrinogen decarboxylase